MKISQIISETTTAGSIATVDTALGATQSRGNPSIYGNKKVGNLFKGKKTKAPYANSINESAEISEQDLSEQDLIVVPGQGRSLKTGFVKHDPDRAEHEGQTLKNSLHTIIRVAKHLDQELSTRDDFPEWVSEKIGATKSMMVSVMDYLISAKEMNHDPDAVDESIENNPVANAIISHVMKYRPDLLKHGADRVGDAIDRIVSRVGNVKYISPDNLNKLIKQVEYYVTSNNHDMYEGKPNTKCVCKTMGQDQCPVHAPLDEGAKVDRMVKHVAQSEKKLGHSKKEAENIAWATANKRGMLDNKNKKK
jgi:hypothetical protein